MQQKATRFLRRVWPAPAVFVCQNLGAFWGSYSGHETKPMVLVLVRFIGGGRNLGLILCPESGLQNAPGFRHRNAKKLGRVVWQWCRSCVPRLPPENPIPCLIPGETSVCQFHGCNLQPAPQAVGAAGLLEIRRLKCYKQLSARQGMWPLEVTELYRQKRCPDAGQEKRTSI